MKYSVGLLFSDDLKQIVLVRKLRPDWQKGLLNGPCGKVEPGETSFTCMVREFEEETGLDINDWRILLVQQAHDNSYAVSYYTAITSHAHLNQLRSKTDELIGVYDVKHLEADKLVNPMAWVIPFAVYYLSGKMDKESLTLKL